jgi:hypothetical protein
MLYYFDFLLESAKHISNILLSVKPFSLHNLLPFLQPRAHPWQKYHPCIWNYKARQITWVRKTETFSRQNIHADKSCSYIWWSCAHTFSSRWIGGLILGRFFSWWQRHAFSQGMMVPITIRNRCTNETGSMMLGVETVVRNSLSSLGRASLLPF